MLVGLRWLQVIYRKVTTENLVKHGFSRPQDMSLTENSDQVSLPGGCNRTQNLRFGPYTNKLHSMQKIIILTSSMAHALVQLKTFSDVGYMVFFCLSSATNLLN